MKHFFGVYLLIIIYSCKNDSTLIQKPANFSDGKYQHYHQKLESAKSNDDYFEIGIQLANLEASPKNIFDNINKGIRQDSSNCEMVITWEMIRQEGGFYNNIVIADTMRFFESLKLCKMIVGDKRYYSILNYGKKEKKPSDTTIYKELRQSLVDTLKNLIQSDQKDRKLLAGPNRKKYIQDKSFRAKIERSDSLNLIIALEIVKRYGGFPEEKYVGKDNKNVLWFIFQHVSDLEQRKKYRPLITDALEKGIIGPGSLEAYDIRTQQVEWKTQ